MDSDDASGGPGAVPVSDQSIAEQAIRGFVEQAGIPGADLLNISGELEALSARAADADVAVRAQQTAVSVLAGAPDDWPLDRYQRAVDTIPVHGTACGMSSRRRPDIR